MPIRSFLSMLVLSIATLAAQAKTTAAEQPQPVALREGELRLALYRQIESAWRMDDIKTLDAMGEDFVLHHSKTPSGKWKLELYLKSLDGLARIEWPKAWRLPNQQDCDCASTDPAHFAEGDRRWAVIDTKLATWSKRYPQSTVAPVVRIRYLLSRAWFYRGSGSADKVDPRAWPLFQRYVDEAGKLLKRNASIRDKNPAWYGEAGMIAVVNDWPQADRDRLYADMIEHGQLYAPAFLTATSYFKPQWGGSYKDVDKLVEQAMLHASEKDGLEFYARFYWNLITNLQPGQEFASNWGRIKAGFDVILDRYPDPWNFRGAATMACKYRDQALFDQAIRQLGISERYQDKLLSSVDCDKIGL